MIIEHLTDAELAALYHDRASLHISRRRVCLHCGTPGRRCPEWIMAATWLITHGHPLPPYVRTEPSGSDRQGSDQDGDDRPPEA